MENVTICARIRRRVRTRLCANVPYCNYGSIADVQKTNRECTRKKIFIRAPPNGWYWAMHNNYRHDVVYHGKKILIHFNVIVFSGVETNTTVYAGNTSNNS